MTISPVTPAASSFATLLSPLNVGQTQLRNRLIMGSMHTRLEHAADPIARQAAFYGERARGGVAMIVTGGHAPNRAGLMEPDAPLLDSFEQALAQRPIVAAVHDGGAKLLLQILHAGRYARHAALVGASAIASPINPRVPRALTADEIEATMDDYVRCAEYARSAGFDGVEVMGSEGYLINQFMAPRTNHRSDAWGGSLENRMRLPVEIVARIRQRLGRGFLIMYRISALDLVEGGATGLETAALAVAVERAGADILSTGIGWHEARVPTIAYMVPRAAWQFAATRIKRAVDIPVVASNRINTPEVAESILAQGQADLVSMARPLLADAHFIDKVRAGRAAEINSCIACNQACLDYIFSGRTATCVVNPRAGREAELASVRTRAPCRVAVIGAGAAGLAYATTAAERGHAVTLFEAAHEIGGQLNLAKRVPGKQEFNELLRYFSQRIITLGIDLRLGTRATRDMLLGGYDRVVIATGVVPRKPAIDGIEHPSIKLYPDVLAGRVEVGARVAIIGSGGIAVDMADYLTHVDDPADPYAAFYGEWGVDTSATSAGGIGPERPLPPARTVCMLQRSAAKPASTLGVSTGWILRTSLRRRRVELLSKCVYERIDTAGLHCRIDGTDRVIAADTIVVCAGQESAPHLLCPDDTQAPPYAVIGGAREAAGIDALRAIEEGVRLAAALP